MKNTDPFAPWNDMRYADDPRAPHNDPSRRDDPFAPWNSPLGRAEDLSDRDAERYGIRRRRGEE